VLELAAVPPIGSAVMLTRPANGVMPVVVEGFNGMLKVTDLRFEPASTSTDVSVALSLEDVVVASVEDGRKIMRYLEQGFGLFPEEFD
jgi:hypothetical protein